MGVWSAIKHLLTIFAYFFDPRVRVRRERKKVYDDFKELEAQYRKALANKKPQLAAQIAKQMQDMRDEYKFLNVVTK